MNLLMMGEILVSIDEAKKLVKDDAEIDRIFGQGKRI